ncbi:FAD/NAD(P)-binding protein [Streptomyces sp. NPDC020800]|uniref:FAD/NAD(P)-binding protein n=1 Tax=Streptomyces sp. NPDC020800 TaxID=3365092 RepID=UPI0037BC4F4D
MTMPQQPPEPYTIAVVGTGPRGISVLERLAALLRDRDPDSAPVHLYAIDAVEIGAGRVWRSDQDDWFTMNTVIGQVTMFSGEPDGGRPRPGAGPSLGEWLDRHAPDRDRRPAPGPDDFASRRDYGRYLRFVHRTIADELPSHVRLFPVRARVTTVRPDPRGGYRVTLDDGTRTLTAHKVVLTTGHPRNEPDGFDRAMLDFTASHPALRYVRGDSAADMDLEGSVRPGAPVAVRGLGLTFYDVLLSLTLGRGGAFVRDGDGTLRYVPCGLEPRIVAGSRSGLPIPARGRNQKAPGHVHPARFLTQEAVAAARARRREATGSPLLDFAEDLLPLLRKEVEHVYWTTQVRARSGAAAAQDFARQHAEKLHADDDTTVLLKEAGLEHLPPLDLRALARPFAGETFSGQAAWTERLLQVMREDLAEAARGTLDGPLKAALDALRDLRGIVRSAIDYGGLLPHSHRDAFLRDYAPVNALLSAGPPMIRSEQLMALMEQGVVEIVGPDTRFGADAARGRFVVESPQVKGSERTAEVLIDARIPTPSLPRDSSPLTRQLLREGLVREFVNADTASGTSFATGGIDIVQGSFRVRDRSGHVHPGLYALGIPTENVRWFTQIGNGRPGVATDFMKVADVVARDVLADLTAGNDAHHEALAPDAAQAVLVGPERGSHG